MLRIHAGGEEWEKQGITDTIVRRLYTISSLQCTSETRGMMEWGMKQKQQSEVDKQHSFVAANRRYRILVLVYLWCLFSFFFGRRGPAGRRSILSLAASASLGVALVILHVYAVSLQAFLFRISLFLSPWRRSTFILLHSTLSLYRVLLPFR